LVGITTPKKSPTGADLWGKKEWTKGVYDPDIRSKAANIYLEMVNFS
jgi:hypothetical protein